MNTCSVHNVSTLQLGDHICIWDKSRWPFRYTHHGIVYQMGTCADKVEVAHVWSAIADFRKSQADSRFQITSLTEFLNHRPLDDMRRVQYNSSIIADAFSRLGEVHRSRSDIPPIVLARCNFLLGMGRGHFDILSLNCEHVALWCKTGIIWSKQLYNKATLKAPFLKSTSQQEIQRLMKLEGLIQGYKSDAEKRNRELQAMDGKRVFLQVGDARFVKLLGRSLYAVLNDPKETDPIFRHQPTAFRLSIDVTYYNCVQITLDDQSTGHWLCSRSHCVKMLNRQPFHRQSLFKFEYGWNGELQSRRNRQWYIGVQTRDGMLRTYNTRDKAAYFKILAADPVDKNEVLVDAEKILLDKY